jgi:hypothetical protein
MRQMPDKITKFILNLSKKEQLFIKNIFNKIISLDLN